MARQGITQEQVFTAADELRDEGIAPTVQTVRERIGSGSFSTINTHLGAWKAQNGVVSRNPRKFRHSNFSLQAS